MAQGQADPADPVVNALIATALAWHEGEVVRTDLAETAVSKARESGDRLVTLRALDVLSATLIKNGRLRDALKVAADRMGLVSDLPRHLPAAATEISDTFHVAINIAVSTGELEVASDFLDRAEVEDPTSNPYVAIPRRIAVFVLIGRYAEAIEQGDELWRAWQRDGTDRRWLAPAFSLTALAHGLSDDDQFEQWRTRTSTVAMADGTPTDWMTARAGVCGRPDGAAHRRARRRPDLVEIAFASSPAGDGRSDGYARAAGAELAVAAGLPDAERADQRGGALRRGESMGRCDAGPCARPTSRSQKELEAAAAIYEQIGAESERNSTLDLIARRAGSTPGPH